ncbi:hypothetical protein H6F93_02745 [Leptolyngbya sp. FACHB-671]|uniref:hypothetical protein n=1 Tax=Leptolyngbya sp. FACHB-671 TaxID=2692812 RepID=UPI001684E056|nr:hypothetical protein [Leptolyngbya sp. FACHB-671]MBD2066453.1 hypothetical protein [Leptolyngbya sp. FACHB-671]
MIDRVFPTPSIDPLTRLHVYDGLMMNADRWLLAEQYHRRRQNVHYQSLHQPGVVCGLGVKQISPPDTAPERFRDRRWLEVQPGIAIDMEGNPIIVDCPLTYRVATESPSTGSVTVYLLISYVEPDNPPYQQEAATIQEQFRLDETTKPPSDRQIELCRIKLQPETVAFKAAKNAFVPEANELDFRYRNQAQAKPQGLVQVAVLQDGDSEFGNRISDLLYLLQSLEALYPSLQGIPVELPQLRSPLLPFDLLYLTGWQLLNFNIGALELLRRGLEAGSTVLVEVSDRSVNLDHVQSTLQQLQPSLHSWKNFGQNPSLRILKTQPFLFSALPISQQPMQLWAGNGVVLVAGELSRAWGLNENLNFARHEIRTAQELGINILNFAWRRQQLMQLSQ